MLKLFLTNSIKGILQWIGLFSQCCMLTRTIIIKDYLGAYVQMETRYSQNSLAGKGPNCLNDRPTDYFKL